MTQRISTFAASFVCTPAPEGMQVTRTVEFGFIPPLSWFMEPILRRTLPADIEREVRGAKELIERDKATSVP